MYPKSFTELVALLGALVPLVMFAVSGLITANTSARDRERADWLRIQELVAIVTNPPAGDKKYGEWQQMMAAEELASSFTGERKIIRSILAEADLYFKNAPGGNGLASRLDSILNRLGKP